ncbi:uncharacterized protein LOC141633708 isoform X4 [Silene latifolia]|uniref:uncharacterized protein LOC141633708 isoform X4 n=1 Tax=Silene latifolia TaxID=37657 RepID=UPI003D78B16F
MELIMASNEASKWIICRPGIEAVFADLRHLSQLFIKISKYDTHRLALHYGNLMRECIQHQSISKVFPGLDCLDIKRVGCSPFVKLMHVHILYYSAMELPQLWARLNVYYYLREYDRL